MPTVFPKRPAPPFSTRSWLSGRILKASPPKSVFFRLCTWLLMKVTLRGQNHNALRITLWRPATPQNSRVSKTTHWPAQLIPPTSRRIFTQSRSPVKGWICFSLAQKKSSFKLSQIHYFLSCFSLQFCTKPIFNMSSISTHSSSDAKLPSLFPSTEVTIVLPGLSTYPRTVFASLPRPRGAPRPPLFLSHKCDGHFR